VIIIAKKKSFSISMNDEEKERIKSYCSTNNLNRSAFVNDVVNRAISMNYCSQNNQTNASVTCNGMTPQFYNSTVSENTRNYRRKRFSEISCEFPATVQNGEIVWDDQKQEDETDEND
jgi:hypothetical protein